MLRPNGKVIVSKTEMEEKTLEHIQVLFAESDENLMELPKR